MPMSKLIAAARFAHTWLSRGLTPIETVASAPVRLAEAVAYAEAYQQQPFGPNPNPTPPTRPPTRPRPRRAHRRS